jgi:hypothetical protein
MAKARVPTSRVQSRSPQNTAFINIPYDKEYEDLYLAFIAGLSGFGLIPHATVEIPGSERRLDRIFKLIRHCRYSFHDLSRVELDRQHPATPRFNMPFELGLAVAWSKARRQEHNWFVFEAVAHRLNKSLSDIGGTDPYIHRGTPRGLFRALTNALSRSRHRPTVNELERIQEDLKKAAREIEKDLRADSLFQARAFKELVYVARKSAGKRIASLRG